MKSSSAVSECSRLALAMALIFAAATSFAQGAHGTGVFPNAAAIEGQLKRGVSTKNDVQRILGVPNGSGGALLPGIGERSQQVDPYQIWYYEDIEITDVKSDGQTANMKMRQQILAVFFKGEVFHGYFWTSNSGTGTAQSR
ncbi:MAG: hypothetical protein JSW31_04265 [Burkholderiales bacterium]|nr:MAG: hypothetical protein JSW31_04265 [Burkholderiales bacterium]